LVGPLEWFGHSTVVVLNELQHLVLKSLDGGKRCTREQLARQDAQPDLDLVQPGAVPGCLVEDDAMGAIAQESRPAVAVFQHTALALNAQVNVQV
jgi:hypothetical protein